MIRIGLLFVLLFLTAGCSTDISVRRVSRVDVIDNNYIRLKSGLTPQTENLLANHLLTEDFLKAPEKVIRYLQEHFRSEFKPEFLFALADVSLRCGRRFHDEEDKAVSYYLAASLFSYGYLALIDKPEEQPYSIDRGQIIHIYNSAVTEIFAYLHSKNLYRKDGFSISSASGQRVTFAPPQYKLPLDISEYGDFKLCSDFEAQNLTHISRHFGLGAPLICDLSKKSQSAKKWAKDLVLPATFYIDFNLDKHYKNITAHPRFIDTREFESTEINKHTVPLSLDFSTPVAYMAKKPLPLHHLAYMLYPDRGDDMKGLYKFESFNDKRIPVVLVHGLMSNTRTWIQMLNTLQNDPDIRKHYQFWGFSYSSGVPVIISASELRKALKEEREKIVRNNQSTEMFDRMVLVGHSMGGLLSKTAIMDADAGFGKRIIEANARGAHFENLTDEHKKFINELFNFQHLDFVKRVIFIAVPHRGSDFARSFVGRLGSFLIRLPRRMLGTLNNMVKSLLPDEKNPHYPTGIDNLLPDSAALKNLSKIPFVKHVPYHSIIGNKDDAGVPDGSDGIVTYNSSHLDGAASELVVKSRHSVQQNPLAIQEVRRILLEHLQSYPDTAIKNKPKIILPAK